MEKIKRSLSIAGLLNHFNENIFSSYEIGSWKPDPSIFLHAAKEMGFKPNQCAVVEDSLVGITAAKAAGMLPIFYDPNKIYDTNSSPCTIQHMSELKSAIT